MYPHHVSTPDIKIRAGVFLGKVIYRIVESPKLKNVTDLSNVLKGKKKKKGNIEILDLGD